MLPLQPRDLGLGGCNHRHKGGKRYGQVAASHLFLGNDGALDVEGDGAFLAVGLDFDGLLKGARTADGAVSHLDFALLAWLDRLGGKLGPGAAARCRRVDDEQRFVPRVGKLKGARYGAFSLLDSAEVVALDLKGRNGLLAVGQSTECYHAHGENRYKKSFGHCLYSSDDFV